MYLPVPGIEPMSSVFLGEYCYPPGQSGVMDLTPECYHAVAKETLDDVKVIDIMKKVNKAICTHVPSSVIADIHRKDIMREQVIDATALIKDVSYCNFNKSLTNR